MSAWRRPYPDVFRVFTALNALLGTVLTFVMAVMVAVHWRIGVARPAAGIGAFMGVWCTLAWRLHRTGLVVGDAGVRVRWLWRTRTIPWTEISGFPTAPDFLVPERLWISLFSGARVRTPVQHANGALGNVLNDGGTWLRGSRYTSLVTELNAQRSAHSVMSGKRVR